MAVVLPQCVTKDYRTREPFDPETDWPAYFYPVRTTTAAAGRQAAG